MSLFSGTWRLVYSSAFASGSLGGFRPGPQAALVPVTIGQVGTPAVLLHVRMLCNDGLGAHVHDSIALPHCSRWSASWQGYQLMQSVLTGLSGAEACVCKDVLRRQCLCRCLKKYSLLQSEECHIALVIMAPCGLVT